VTSNFRNWSWYALQIRGRFEKLATKQLRDRGYDAYLPVFKSERRWSDRVKTVEKPLFSGYLFCKFDIEHKLPVLVVPGVLSIVGTGKVPATIPESQISSLQKIIASGMQCGPWPFVQNGQPISVARGPLAGVKGTVIEVKSSLRLILSLPLLHRSVAVEVDRNCVDIDDTRPVGSRLHSTVTETARW
jgi:transcription antitermination factor NusG